jgi:hypothetical protein
MPILASWGSKMKLNDSLATKRSAVAERACRSCRELPIELVEHYFPESIDQVF